MEINDATSLVMPDESILKQIHGLLFTDGDNAEAMTLVYGNRFRYVHNIGWYWWDGAVWQFDEEGKLAVAMVSSLAKLRRQVILKYDSSISKEELDKKLRAVARLESELGQKSCLKIAGSMQPFSTLPEKLDTNKKLLGCSSLTRTPKIYALKPITLDLKIGGTKIPDREDLITRSIGVPYDPEATCPRFEQFLREIFVLPNGEPDEGLIAFIKRALGYSLTGETKEQVLFFCYGQGANGKSTLLKIIKYVLADYADTLFFSSLMEHNGNVYGNDIAKLRGKRFVTAMEPNPDRYLDEAKIKLLTGEDEISVRFLRQEFFEFYPNFKLWLACNNKPMVKGTDEGFWRRVKAIPFNASFPEGKGDKDLFEKLKAEGSGILNLLLAGAKEWAEKGLEKCRQVDEASQEYRSQQDVFSEFLITQTKKAPGGFVTTEEITVCYNDFAQKNNFPLRNAQSIGNEMKNRGYQKGTSEKRGAQKRGYRGIDLQP